MIRKSAGKLVVRSWAWLVLLVGGVGLPLAAWAADPPPLTSAVLDQIATLQAEKAARTPGQQKMDSQLIYKAKKRAGKKLGAGLAKMEERLVVADDGRELVDIDCEVTETLLADLRAAGAEIVAAVPRFQSIRARMPLAQIEAFAGRAEVRFIKPAVQAHTHVGAKNSEGDAPHRADLVRAQLKATGRGLKVGILSDSVDSLASSQATGDLGPVTVLPGQSGLNGGNSGEGTAMLEIVHDLAPDAELFFASAFVSEAQFAQNVLDLRSAGCDIIVDDVGYYDESPLQDGPVAQAVDQVVASGALYFSAAGNEGNLNDGTSGVWEGDFADGGASGPLITKGGRVHSFGTLNYNVVTTNGSGASLFWSDPARGSRNDYDLYLLDSTGTSILASSTNTQNGTQDPYEIVATSVNARLVIVKSSGAQPRFLHLNTLRGVLQTQTSGTIQGHPAAANAIAVAAVNANASNPNPFTKANVVETFSTDGDRRVFYNTDGTPLTPGNLTSTGGVLRKKPEMAAADGVSTSVPGFLPFYGTSAAAPHAGAIAALVWSRNRTLTAAQVRTALTSTALDIEAVGYDRDSGAGLLDALAAAQAVSGGVTIQPGTVTKTAESFTPANNFIDPGETITVALPLQNTGSIATANLTAVLLSSGGVSNPSPAASYGVLAPGATLTRSFSFQANGAVGNTITATFRFYDGGIYLGASTANFTLGTTGTAVTFNNTAAITIPTSGIASPYPSAINVTGMTGNVAKVTATLNGFGHAYPSDVDILLVSPTGRKVILLSDAGGLTAVSGLNLTFDDAASSPAGNPLATGTFKPTAAGATSLSTSLTTPAPAAPYDSTLATFADDTPNGAWQLWVRDQFTPDAGSIATGWTLRVTPTVPPLTNGPGPDLTSVLEQSTTLLTVGENVTYTITVYNNGPAPAANVVVTDTLPSTLVFGAGSSTVGTVTNSGNAVTVNLGTLGSGQKATISIVATGANSGLASNTASVTTSGQDNNPGNNLSNATLLTVGQPNLTSVQPPGWSSGLVVSTVTGTNTDSTNITASTPVYVDVAYANNGTSSAHEYYVTQVLVDGVLLRTLDRQLDLGPGTTDTFLDLPLGTFAPGNHTLQVKVDALGDVAESNETDNVLTRVFHVQGANLTLAQPPGWTNKIVLSKTVGTNMDSPSFNTDDNVYLDRAITNTGEIAVTAATTSQLYVDDVLMTTWPVPAPLAVGGQDRVLDFPLGKLAAGPHLIRVVVDAGGAIPETDETDNSFVRSIVVNALPTISALAPLALLEDGASAPLPLTVGDAETAPGQLVLSVVTSNAALLPVQSISLAGTGASRTLQVTPLPNAFGSAQVTVTVADGSGGTASSTLQVTVAPVNDVPSFNQGPSVTVLEDSGTQATSNWATALSAGPANEAAQQLAFQLITDNPDLFAVAPSLDSKGTLSFTPASNASGTATVSVRLQDSGGTSSGGVDTSAVQTFTIQVLPVNDAPTFVIGSSQTQLQTAGQITIPSWASALSAGPANEAGQSLSFTVTATHPEIFSTLPAVSAEGALTYTLSGSASGTSTVSVQLRDSGGTLNGGQDASAVQTFSITSVSINEAPTFTVGPDLDVARDAGAQSLPRFITGISAGPADEVEQTVTFTAVADHRELFARQPEISPDGTLTFSPAPAGSGTAIITVTLQDSGPTGGPDVNTSAPQTFLIRVTALAEETGAYVGLVQPVPGVPQENGQAGLLTVKISKSGGFTGKLTLGGKRIALKGAFDNSGTARFGKSVAPSLELVRKEEPPLALALHVDVGGGTNKLTGTLAEAGQAYALISADRSLYTAKAPKAPFQNVPTSLLGKYTVILAARTPAELGRAAATYPQGDGVATLSVNKSGTVKLVGSLADGTRVSYANKLSLTQEWPFYVSLYKGGGSISGPVTFRDRPSLSDLDGLGLHWFKPDSKAKIYPAGWPAGITTDLVGSHYAGTGFTGLGANGNALVSLSEAMPMSDLQKTVSIGPKGKVTITEPGEDHLALAIKNATGLITGKFDPAGSVKNTKIQGVVFPKQNSAFGYYLNGGASGSLTIVPKETPPVLP